MERVAGKQYGRNNIAKNLYKDTLKNTGVKIQLKQSEHLILNYTTKMFNASHVLFEGVILRKVIFQDDYIKLLATSEIIHGDIRLKDPNFFDYGPEITRITQEYLKTHDSIFKPEFDFLSPKVVPVDIPNDVD